MIAFVLMIVVATLTALSSAFFVTFNGSMMPASYMSTTSPVLMLTPL
jgi:hypothetical protein